MSVQLVKIMRKNPSEKKMSRLDKQISVGSQALNVCAAGEDNAQIRKGNVATR